MWLLGGLLRIFTIYIQHCHGLDFFERKSEDPLFASNFNVQKLDESAYQQMLSQNNDSSATIWVVDFYSPFCPHCIHFAPEWELLADYYAENHRVRVAVVDCHEYGESICTTENIWGYPTIKIFPGGKIFENNYERHADGIAKWLDEYLEERAWPPLEMKKAATPSESARTGVERVIPKPVDSNFKAKELRLRRLQDAGTALMFSLRHGLFLGTPVLNEERYDAAVEWLDVVAGVFPFEGNRLKLAELLEQLKSKSAWTSAQWFETLDDWIIGLSEPNREGRPGVFPVSIFSHQDTEWEICISFTCGLWTMFHLLSANVVTATNGIEPANVMSAIRSFVKYFFGCQECVTHFLEANPESIVSQIAREENSQQALSLWMWKMHNSVSERVGNPVWPLPSECAVCYLHSPESQIAMDDAASSRYEEDQVFDFLQSTYYFPQRDEEEQYVQTYLPPFRAVALLGLITVLLSLTYTLVGRCRLSRRHAARGRSAKAWRSKYP